jgi:ABC-2 type transport system ATP-binding protein
MPDAGGAAALQVRNLRKEYKDVVAVNGLDLEVRRGECFGLLGPNGAGKTTTIEICEGLTAADSGEVELLGLHWKSDANELRQRLGIQLQETQLSEKLTVLETVRLFRSFFRAGPPPAEVIGLVQLEEKQNSRVGGLSGGQKQRLAMACALVGDPEFLFLDEPTTGLDPQARRQLWELIERFKLAGRTILLTTHYMDEAERLCDRVAILNTTLRTIGRTDELRDHLFNKTLTVRTRVPLPEPGKVFTGLPAVDGWSRDGAGGYVLTVSDPAAAAPPVTRALVAAGADVLSIGESRHSLEDVYLELIDTDDEASRT